jgi:hypothetical protein
MQGRIGSKYLVSLSLSLLFSLKDFMTPVIAFNSQQGV